MQKINKTENIGMNFLPIPIKGHVKKLASFLITAFETQA